MGKNRILSHLNESQSPDYDCDLLTTTCAIPESLWGFPGNPVRRFSPNDLLVFHPNVEEFIHAFVNTINNFNVSPPDMAECLDRIIAATNELFPGTIEIERSPDPEFPEDVAVVFLVTSSEDTATTMSLEGEWHERVAAIAPGSKTKFRIIASSK